MEIHAIDWLVIIFSRYGSLCDIRWLVNAWISTWLGDYYIILKLSTFITETAALPAAELWLDVVVL